MSDRANVAVLPPLIPVAAMAIGFGLDLRHRVRIADPFVVMPLGVMLVVISVLLVLLAGRELARWQTAFDVRKPTTRLVRTRSVQEFVAAKSRMIARENAGWKKVRDVGTVAADRCFR
jgi:hypothetical protein